MKYSEGGNTELICFKGSDIAGDDVVLDADTDLNMTPAQRRAVIFELMDRGLLSDGEGKMSAEVKKKILSILGYQSLAEMIAAQNGGENNGN